MAQIIVCDICGKHPAKRISLCTGSEMGPAGSTDGIYEQVDICFDCLVGKISSQKNDVLFNKEIMSLLQTGAKK